MNTRGAQIGSPAPARVRFARAVLRRYPFPRGRLRLSALLLSGSPRGPHHGPPGLVLEAMPEGEVVQCRHDLHLRLRQDEAYVEPYLHGEYEPANTRLYRRLVEPGQTVFDVGANFGWYTALFARLVGPGGTVHAFEPVRHLAELAAETVRLNGVEETVRLNETALGASEGDLVVYTFSDLPQGHASSSPLGRADAVPHRCSLTTLDAYAASAGCRRLDFLKVDVEGHERDVFVGGRSLLGAEEAPIVAFEINEGCLAARGLAAADVVQPLMDMGYTRLWLVRPKGRASEVDRPLEGRTADYLAAKPASVARVERALC